MRASRWIDLLLIAHSFLSMIRKGFIFKVTWYCRTFRIKSLMDRFPERSLHRSDLGSTQGLTLYREFLILPPEVGLQDLLFPVTLLTPLRCTLLKGLQIPHTNHFLVLVYLLSRLQDHFLFHHGPAELRSQSPQLIEVIPPLLLHFTTTLSGLCSINPHSALRRAKIIIVPVALILAITVVVPG